jgi:multiple sugar transport system ATP-binding protein
MTGVVLKKAEKIYPNGFRAVHAIDLQIDNGEFMVLVGPSGCAKSTTLRMIAGLEDITSGEIRIDDRIVNDIQPKDRDIAMVFQNYALYPHMTAYENMAFVLKLRKTPQEEIRRRVHEAADILDITAILNRKPRQLSGGQMQRVAVGRSIVRHPKVFLFDEPLSNLDAKLRVQMRVEISRLHNRLKSTMIYVTHDQVEAMTMGDRICVMEGGRIKQLDTPSNLYHKPANLFVAGFIGSPAMNLVQARLLSSQGTYQVKIGSMTIDIPEVTGHKASAYVGKDVIFGLRPEDIYSQTNCPLDLKKITDCDVILVENMGNDLYVHVSRDGHTFIARLSPDTQVEKDAPHPMIFDTQRCHLFDKDSGESLTTAPQGSPRA